MADSILERNASRERRVVRTSSSKAAQRLVRLQQDPSQGHWTIDTWTSFPGPGFCGSWATEYKEMHARMRRGEIPAKYITYMPFKTGLGDLFNGIVATFIAALVSRRAMIIMNPVLDVVLEPGEIDWHLGGDVNTKIDTNLRQEIKESGTVFHLRRLNWPKKGGFVEFPAATLEYFRLLDNATNVVVSTNGGILSRIFAQKKETYKALHSMGLRMPYAFGCMMRFLFRTKPEVLQFLREPMAELHVESTGDASSALAPAPAPSATNEASSGIVPSQAVFPNALRPAVCVHLRTRDGFAFRGRDKSHFLQSIVGIADTILDCAKRLSDVWLPPGVNARWLFLSDTNELVQVVKDKHGQKIMRSPHTPKHIADQPGPAIFSTYADWLLFSTCDFYVITESGFSKTSAAFNLNRPKMVLMPFRWRKGLRRPGALRISPDACKPLVPNSLLDFREWSGL